MLIAPQCDNFRDPGPGTRDLAHLEGGAAGGSLDLTGQDTAWIESVMPGRSVGRRVTAIGHSVEVA